MISSSQAAVPGQSDKIEEDGVRRLVELGTEGENWEMTKRIARSPKKLVVLGVRVDDEFLRNLIRWISENEPEMSRPEAIRRLVEIGMKAKK